MADMYELWRSGGNIADPQKSSQPNIDKTNFIKTLLQYKAKYILMASPPGTDRSFFFTTIVNFFNEKQRNQ